MPDIQWKTKDEIPEGLREYAEEKNGAFVVDVAPGRKHKEFRDNNVALLKERDELKAKFLPYGTHLGDSDPAKLAEELTALRLIKQQVDDGTLKGTEAIQKRIDAAVKSEKDGWENTRKGLEVAAQTAAQKAQTWETRFKGSQLDQTVASAVLAADSGFAPSALTDIQGRARAAWKVADNGVLSLSDGDVPVYSKKEPGTPMPMKEWLEELGKAAPHFLKPSAGGGASGGRAAGKDFGMSDEVFQKLSPAERLNIARERGTSR